MSPIGIAGLMAGYNSSSAAHVICIGPVCESDTSLTLSPALTSALDEWWAVPVVNLGHHPPGRRTLDASVSRGCDDCTAASANAGLRPCSRSAERQESFVLALATAMGAGPGSFFLELGGHNGLHASNTIFTEACRGWRGLMIEANPVSFTRMRIHRPAVLATRGAVCSTVGNVTFAARRSVGAAKRGTIRPAVDETGGVESMMGRTFEKAGYATSAPTAWLYTQRAYRIVVPCAPLRDYLSLLRIRRVDVFWHAARPQAHSQSHLALTRTYSHTHSLHLQHRDCAFM